MIWNSPSNGWRPSPEVYACPVCGQWPVRQEHGSFRCTRCGQIVETCCEGAPSPELSRVDGAAELRAPSHEGTMHLQSRDFADGGRIARRFTCDGENLSPPLEWSDPPEGTRSLVLLCRDPDAPGRVWRHWAAYDISPKKKSLPLGASHDARKLGFRQAVNDFGQPAYGGPCPPHGHGRHHYEFRLLALAVSELGVGDSPSCEQVEREAIRHLLAEAILTGTYER